MHVGIAGQTYFPQADIDDFRAAAGLSATKLNMVCISTADCTDVAGESVGDIGEADLDVEWSSGVAKDATVDFVYAAADDPEQGVFSAAVYLVTTYKVDGAVVPVISISYASCETQFSANMRTVFDGFLEEAAAQGQSVLNSAGDAGAAGCDQGNTIATQGAVADYPASSPYVTGVGGTTFSADGSVGSPEPGANEYWSYSSTADVVSSALQYIPETSWKDTVYDQSLDPTNTLTSGGGGVSAGSTGCVGGLVGYEATAGYDLVTGLGSINGGALYAALAPPTYTLGTSSSSITIRAGSNAQFSLTLTATNYPGMVSFATSISSINGTPSGVSASAPSVNFASSSTGNSTLTITTTTTAANHSPRLPWKSGGSVMFCAALLGAPFTGRRRKRALAVLLTALAISAAGLLVACSGSGGNLAQSPQRYTVTVTPTGSGTVMNPAAITVTVTVQ